MPSIPHYFFKFAASLLFLVSISLFSQNNTPTTTEQPTQTQTVTKQVVKTPATVREVEVPAEYQTITYERKVQSGGFSDWVEMECDTPPTSPLDTKNPVLQLQKALKNKGYDPGSIDGVMGQKTRIALEKFARENGFGTDTFGAKRNLLEAQ